MSIWGKAIKIDLLKLAEELGISVDASATVLEIKGLIEGMKNYAEEINFIKDLLVTIRENRIEQEERRLEREQAERRLEREQEERRLEREERRLEREQAEKIELEKARLDYELQLAKVRVSLGELNSTLPCPAVENKRKFTLPKLEFRQFGDDLKDWLPFWSQFKSIHEDDDIANEDKFQYLIQATAKGSRARAVVESFPPTGENYEKAVDSLKSRFGKDDLLVEMYVRELLKLILSAQVKDKVCLTSLYDKLESHLRNLETLKVTTDRCAAILYPMVESCFPVQFLKAWNRSNAASSSTDSQERLKKLMDFLRTEVEGEERINLAVAGFGLSKDVESRSFEKENYAPDYLRNRVPTAANLFMSTTQGVDKRCIFCSGKHRSSECFYAQKMILSERQQIVKDNRCCFACLQPGHLARNCRSSLRCLVCSRKHVPLMCDRLEPMNKVSPQKEEIENGPAEKGVNLSNLNKRSTRVFLQTLKAKLLSSGKQKIVRLLLDSGSHKSYISKSVAIEMEYSPLRQEKLTHSLFGGVSTEKVTHDCYKIFLRNLDDAFTCNFEVLGQDRICENIRPVSQGPWIKELEAENVQLSDISDSCEPVDVLIGADIMGRLLTGKRKILSSGLVALETLLGWTLMGKAGEEASGESLATTVTSLFVKEADVSNLRRLDLIGITDSIEKKSKQEIDLQTREHFLETVSVNKDSRYEVCLPWADDKSPLTYIFENNNHLTPITPSMFLRENVSADVTDIDHAESRNFQKRIRYRGKLLEDLRKRFRKEYLGQLVMKPCQGKGYRDVQVGEVVLIGGDNPKRIHWPLARIMEVFPGRDGRVRAVELRTQNGLLVRPIQRIYPLEVDSSNVDLGCLREEISDVPSVPLRCPSPDRLQLSQRTIAPEVDVSFPVDHPLETVEPIKRSRYGRELRPPDRL